MSWNIAYCTYFLLTIDFNVGVFVFGDDFLQKGERVFWGVNFQKNW